MHSAVLSSLNVFSVLRLANSITVGPRSGLQIVMQMAALLGLANGVSHVQMSALFVL
jgi:hypothetical protein